MSACAPRLTHTRRWHTHAHMCACAHVCVRAPLVVHINSGPRTTRAALVARLSSLSLSRHQSARACVLSLFTRCARPLATDVLRSPACALARRLSAQLDSTRGDATAACAALFAHVRRPRALPSPLAAGRRPPSCRRAPNASARLLSSSTCVTRDSLHRRRAPSPSPVRAEPASRPVPHVRRGRVPRGRCAARGMPDTWLGPEARVLVSKVSGITASAPPADPCPRYPRPAPSRPIPSSPPLPTRGH